MVPVSEPETKICGRILLSDVVVKSKRNVLWVLLVLFWPCIFLLSLFAPFFLQLRCILGCFYFVTGLLDITTLSFHGNLSHRTFKLPKWL
uniref:Uncharacterized protein MANES_04G112800 n=1 Tax=Rhizophora mucronata TaxID=61149 RepID=A0A2P2N4Q7_RHIMU